ncbi:MAG: putative membrane protein [Cenarchaeum symbiont of Oopsacas minuta]|nr:putative membrane protein [Cenarchaeum symbiont of Oopsacas minuta]
MVKLKIRTIVLLATIWFVVTLPLPWLINNPDVQAQQFYTILGIIGVMSIPFVGLGIAWTLKPELVT